MSSQPESEWDADQQALVLAFLRYRSQVHAACGGYLPETTAPEAEGVYVVGPPTRCHLCTARAMKAEQYAKAKHPHALLYAAEKR